MLTSRTLPSRALPTVNEDHALVTLEGDPLQDAGELAEAQI
jgi:hypothetical protein